MKKKLVLPAVPGFKAAGIACGIKKQDDKDLALMISETPAVAAGVFTTNPVRSPTVDWCREALKKSRTHRAIIVNSGNANACTGPGGETACREMAVKVAEQLDVSPHQVLVNSTGVIGVALPVEKITRAVPELLDQLSSKGWMDAGKAILTTDLAVKTARTGYKDGSQNITIGGIAKGSGMIHPNMATLLGYVFTDVAIERTALKSALREACDASFNAISVDGDTSTNDAILCFANGRSGNVAIKKGERGYAAFVEALTKVCLSLAKQVVLDGEGATKFITVDVRGAKTNAQAHKVAQAVATSSLVKTACFGEDPNWGRILAAVGYSGAMLDPNRIDIALNAMPLVRGGNRIPGVSLKALEKRMKKKDLLIAVNLNVGKGDATMYTCDFSYDYVRINAEYTT